MKLTVEKSFGDCREIVLLDVQPSDKVADVIAKIREQEGIDNNINIHLNLFRNSRLLDESKTLAECTSNSAVVDRNRTLILSPVGPLGRFQINVTRRDKKIQIDVNGYYDHGSA